MKQKIISLKQKKLKTKPNLVDYEKIYPRFEWQEAEKELDWFPQKKLNAAYNAIDRQAKGSRKNKVALYWEGENGEKEKYTFAELNQLSNQFGNVLKKLGVKRGERVFFFLPRVPELYLGFLGTLKIGAIAGTLFSAFGHQALLDRLKNSGAKVVVTNKELYQRVVKIEKQLPELEKVLLIDAEANKKGKFGLSELILKASDKLNCARMSPSDAAFMLYTSGCCHQDTLIQLADGTIKKISTLVEKGGSDLININLRELKENRDSIKGRYKYNYSAPLYRLQTPLNTGMFTPNHPFFVLNKRGQIIEKKTEELKKGDYVLMSTKINIKGTKQKMPKLEFKYQRRGYPQKKNAPTIPEFLTPPLGQLFGYLLGDGSLKESGIDMTDKDRQLLLFYKNLIEKETNLRTYVKTYSRQRLLIHSKPVAVYMRRNFPEIFFESRKRLIPEIVFKSPKNCIASFIRGFYDAEGSVIGNEVRVTSTSQLLIQALQMLFLRFGIVANYFEEERKTNFPKKNYYKVRVYGLKITDRSSLGIFKEKLGFSSVKKQKKLENLLKNLRGKKTASMINLLPIGNLLYSFRKTMKLPKGESHQLFLDSYMYSNRKIRKEKLPIIIKYLEEKIKLLEKIDLKGKKNLKKVISLLKISKKELAEFSEKSPLTVHQYLYSSKPGVSGKSLGAFYENLAPYILEIKKNKLVVLNNHLYKLKRLSRMEDVGFFEVKKINEVKNETGVVYDLTASCNHNYIANSFVVHNTTGKPKGIVHSHQAILLEHMTAKWVLDLKEGDVYWCTADPGWVTGIAYEILGSWSNGASTLVYEGRFDPGKWYQLIEDYRVTVWYTAPTAIRMLAAKDSRLVKKYDFSSLRHLASVGEPLNPEAIYWGLKAFGLPFHDNWWQTETGGILIANYPCLPIKPGSMGKPVPGVKAVIVNDKGRKLGVNKIGNLAIKPPWPSMMKKVWRRPKKYKSYFVGGWYISGDLAYKDKEGYFWFVGRADDVIKTAGERVGPFEVESALVSHPSVAEAAVIGKPDPIRGEIIKAFIALKPLQRGSENLKKAIQTFVKRELAGHAYPREIEFVEKLPKTRSGKIVRRLLKAKELGLPAGDVSTLEEY